MCNCGSEGKSGSTSAGAKEAARAGIQPRASGAAAARAEAPAPFGKGAVIEPRRFVDMVYVGATGLTALGPVTETRYRFDRPGARLRVDARDAPALAAVPKIRFA